jgi:hypothetical protein
VTAPHELRGGASGSLEKLRSIQCTFDEMRSMERPRLVTVHSSDELSYRL